jgi:hypothetical protein
MEVPLSWAGPFVFVPQPGFECVFDRPETSSPGLYLWTVEFENGYLVNYVGETGRNLWDRLVEGLAWSFGGREGSISDPEQFRQGRAVTLARFSISEFLSDYPRLSAAIHGVYRCYRVFIAPTRLEKSVREYIEAGIIRTLQSSGGQVAAFLCNSRIKGRSPEPLSARFVTGQRFHGIGEVIDC